MKPVEIRIELLRRGYTNAQVAKSLGLSRTAVGEVIHGRQKSRRVADRIAQLTGISVHTLWPSLYQPKIKRAVARKPLKRAARSVRG